MDTLARNVIPPMIIEYLFNILTRIIRRFKKILIEDIFIFADERTLRRNVTVNVRNFIFSFNHSSFFASLKFTFRNREPWESIFKRRWNDELGETREEIATGLSDVFHVSSAGTSVVKKPCNFARTRHVSFLPRAPPFLRFDRSTNEPGKEKSLCEPFAGGRREGGVNLPRRKSTRRRSRRF